VDGGRVGVGVEVEVGEPLLDPGPGGTPAEVSGELSVERDLTGRHALRGERDPHGGCGEAPDRAWRRIRTAKATSQTLQAT
jgi:hypothetical protein